VAILDVLKSFTNYGEPNRINYRAYDLTDTKVVIGSIPPVPIHGLSYVVAYHHRPQVRRFSSMTGKSVYAGNLNSSGIIEIGLQSDCISVAMIQILELTGLPFPCVVTDIGTSGFSTVVASEMREVGTPEWRRAALPSLSIHTFDCGRLLINNGPRRTV
jgi:hypothetical protein